MVHFFKPKQYKLRIDNPCSENWEKMTPTQEGKFCQSCSKNVIDFTNLSDQEILKIISNSSGRLCGRLTKDQLSRNISHKKEISAPGIFSKIAASMLLIGLSKSTNAAYERKAVAIEFPKISQENQIDQQQTIVDSAFVFKGKVLDSLTKEEIPGVIVRLKGSSIDATTGINGDFELRIPDYSERIELTIELISIGYNTREIIVHTNNLPTKTEYFLTYDKSLVISGDLVVEWHAPETKKAVSPEKAIPQKNKWWQFRKK